MHKRKPNNRSNAKNAIRSIGRDFRSGGLKSIAVNATKNISVGRLTHI
jgi:hypothetical protein